MSFTPKAWNTGDRVNASDMNRIENGVANAGNALIVGASGTWTMGIEPGVTLNKTFLEIYEALASGASVVVKYTPQTSGPLSDYTCGAFMYPVIGAFKYNQYYRLYVSIPTIVDVGSVEYGACSSIAVFSVSSVSDYPEAIQLITTASSSRIDYWD